MITPEETVLGALNSGGVWHLQQLADFVDLPDRVVEKALEKLIQRGEVEAATIEGRLRYRRVSPVRVEE